MAMGITEANALNALLDHLAGERTLEDHRVLEAIGTLERSAHKALQCGPPQEQAARRALAVLRAAAHARHAG